MLAWQKRHYVSKEKARALNSGELEGRTVFGNFRSLKEYLGFLPDEE
jgi:hypothetical protein